jgi:hypothetical protein
MNDPILESLERREKRIFARVVFIAKIITWTALLVLAAIVESALVIKAAQIEFSSVSTRFNLIHTHVEKRHGPP